MVSPSLPECVAMVERLAPVLLDTAARSVVVLGLAGLAALALRRASAAARHWVWLLGVVGLLLLPVLSASLPGWHVLPRLGVVHDGLVPSAIAEAPSIPGPAEPVLNLTPRDEPPTNAEIESKMTGQQEIAPVQADTPAAASVQPAGLVSPVNRFTPTRSPAATQLSPLAVLPWTFWLVLIWFLVSLLVLGHMFLGYLSLWSLQRRCGRLNEGDWPEQLRQLCQLLKIRRAVELLSSPQRTMPMTWGLWHTRLLLPEQAAAWPTEQRRAVLLHELGHARRWDCLTQLLAQIACALYWFNPLVWVAWRRIQVERERACDDLVLNTGTRASAYAEHLLHSASALPALRFVGAAVAMARPSTLEERLRAILDARRNRRGLSRGSAIATFALLLGALVPVAALQAQANPARGPAVASVVPPPPGYPTEGSVPLPPGYSTTPVPIPSTRPETSTPAARGGGRGGAFTPTPVPGNGPTCTLDATIYDVRLPVDQIGRLDLDTIGTQNPYVTNSQVTNSGQAINSVSYTQTGALFNIAGKAGASNNIELDLSIQLARIIHGVS